MERIRAAVIGVGYIGLSHVEAVRRIGGAEIVAVADSNAELAARRAAEYRIGKCYGTIEQLLEDPEIDVVHNCTPNHLHCAVNEGIIRSGKHLLAEKPLARTIAEADHLVSVLEQHPQVQACVNFNYRMNPLLQEMRDRIAAGEIGVPKLIHGSYLQDWLLYDTDYNWRIEPEYSGPSRCVADIGSHWMDIVQHLLGGRITAVSADLVTVHPTRKKPRQQTGTFSQSDHSDSYEERVIETEDYAAVLFHMDNGVHGVFHVSEVSAGHGCYFGFEVNGTKASFAWNQESCDRMWQGFRDDDNRLIMRDPSTLSPHARQYTHLAKGHPEGWNDAFRNNIRAFYDHILAVGRGEHPAPDFATFREAAHLQRLTEAILESGRTGSWVSV